MGYLFITLISWRHNFLKQDKKILEFPNINNADKFSNRASDSIVLFKIRKSNPSSATDTSLFYYFKTIENNAKSTANTRKRFPPLMHDLIP